MTVFLDAHALIWAIFKPDELSPKAAEIIADRQNSLLVSDATLWELLNKIGRGRLPATGASVPSVVQRVRDFGVQFVPIEQQDAITCAMLPHHHSDPFDRILIAQAIRLQHPVVTIDGQFAKYDIATVW